MTFLARLNPATYTGDEPVGVAAVLQKELPGPVPDERWQYIPERMWKRILSLGEAYELHFASTLEPVLDTVLNSTQCDVLEEEFRFLASVMNDAAVREALQVILVEIAKLRGHSDMALVISPP